jgi:hypothetical protein
LRERNRSHIAFKLFLETTTGHRQESTVKVRIANFTAVLRRRSMFNNYFIKKPLEKLI